MKNRFQGWSKESTIAYVWCSEDDIDVVNLLWVHVEYYIDVVMSFCYNAYVLNKYMIDVLMFTWMYDAFFTMILWWVASCIHGITFDDGGFNPIVRIEVFDVYDGSLVEVMA